MLDAESVITTATDGLICKLAERREISRSRMQEILGKDNPYPKAKRLIRDIAAINQAGARLIKADLLAMFDDILDPHPEPVTDAELHGELNDAVQARLRNAPVAVRLKEDREALEIISRDISEIENEVVPIRAEMAAAVEAKRRNGHK